MALRYIIGRKLKVVGTTRSTQVGATCIIKATEAIRIISTTGTTRVVGFARRVGGSKSS